MSMGLRWGLLGLMLVLGGCVTSPPPAPPAPAPSVPANKPAPIPPAPIPVPAQKPTPEPAPVTGSGPAIAPPPLPEPEKPLPATPAATLLTQVQAAINAGELDKAAALCERALRISPRDAQLWYQLASIRLRQRRFEDAAGTARRALSMTNDASLKQKINDLIQQSGR